MAYVHLGTNPSPTLLSFSKQASTRLTDAEFVLITDHPELWLEFTGRVLTYKKSNRPDKFKKFARRNPEFENLSNGYWLFTIERIFALSILADKYPENTTILHFESDVFISINQDIVEILKGKFTTVAIPRFSDTTGIASLIFIPTISSLNHFIKCATMEIENDSSIRDDMRLIGTLLNSGQVDELPSGRNQEEGEYLEYFGYKILIDGAAVGQYLFGQDPVHTANRIISGYVNPNFPIDLRTYQWSIQKIRNFYYVCAEDESSKIVITTMHVHSKVNLPEISPSSTYWIRVLLEANGKSERIQGNFVPDQIHSLPVGFFNRIRIARRSGLLKSAKRRTSALFNKKKVP